MALSQISTPKVGTLLFLAILGLLTVVHSAPPNTVAQEEVYREAVTDGYIIDNFYLNLFTTESSKTPGAAQASQQPSPEEKDTAEASGDIDDKAETSVVLQYGGKSTSTTPSAWSTQQPSLGSKESDVSEETEDSRNISVFLQHGGKSHLSTTTSVPPALSTQESKEIDLMEGSGEITDVSNFLQKGNERNVSTTTSVAPARSTGQPSSESEERDSSDGSGDTVDSSIFPQHGRRHNVPTTASVTHTQSPSTAVLPGDNDESGSGDMWLSDGDIIHATTSSSMSGSYTEMNMASNYMSAPRMINVAAENSSERRVKDHGKDVPSMGHRTPGWIIILAFIVAVAAVILACIAIATRDKWNAPSKALSPDSESKMKSINQQRDVEMETFLHKDQPRENGRVTEYTVIPLDELPEKYSSD